MRGVALGLCVTFAAALGWGSASASPVLGAIPVAESSTPASVNDHNGNFIPSQSEDRGFTINPDGDVQPVSGESDQDEDGSDVAIYQGEDDQLPS